MNVNISIKLRDVCLVTAGVVVGAAAISLFNQHNIKKMKKEFIDKQTKTIKKELKQEIKESVKIDEIVNEIKEEIEDSIIDDTLKEMTDKTARFMAKVDIRLEKYEKELNRMSTEVLNFDARVGKIVNGAIKTVGGIMTKGGEDYED